MNFEGNSSKVVGSEVGNLVLPHEDRIKSEREDREEGDIIPVLRTAASFPTSGPSADLADFEAYIVRQTRGWAEPVATELAAFLRAHPGMSIADWKGKGLSAPLDAAPRETPWARLKPAEMREEAISTIARDLPRNVRQAAGRDPGLIWNPLARKYRLRLPSDF